MTILYGIHSPVSISKDLSCVLDNISHMAESQPEVGSLRPYSIEQPVKESRIKQRSTEVI